MKIGPQQWIQRKIPALKNFDFSISELAAGQVSLKLPLEPHKNHKGTAFGGSLYNSAVIACYLLAHTELSARGESTDSFVIADGAMKYLKPVPTDFSVHSSWKNEDIETVLSTLRSKKKAHWFLKAEIRCHDVTCAEFQGRFALRQNE
jgi:thioesterase domain-containing protein